MTMRKNKGVKPNFSKLDCQKLDHDSLKHVQPDSIPEIYLIHAREESFKRIIIIIKRDVVYIRYWNPHEIPLKKVLR